MDGNLRTEVVYSFCPYFPPIFPVASLPAFPAAAPVCR
jgi:hypothetical protein